MINFQFTISKLNEQRALNRDPTCVMATARRTRLCQGYGVAKQKTENEKQEGKGEMVFPPVLICRF